jgi:hypothetical protein
MRRFKAFAVVGGALGWLPAIWQAIRFAGERIFQWGEHIEFAINRTHELEYVGPILEFLLNPPPWFGAALIPPALAAMYWGLRQSRANATAPTTAYAAANQDPAAAHPEPAPAGLETGAASFRPQTNWTERVPIRDVSVTFERLDEFLLTFKFTFYNGIESTVARTKLTGIIYLVKPSEHWEILREPQFQGNQSRLHNPPLKDFELVLEQRVSKDQKSLIRQKSEAGEPISFVFTALHIWLETNDQEFRAWPWDGISCCQSEAGTWRYEKVDDADALNQVPPSKPDRRG